MSETRKEQPAEITPTVNNGNGLTLAPATESNGEQEQNQAIDAKFTNGSPIVTIPYKKIIEEKSELVCIDPALLPKTSGERKYGWLQFLTGEIFILGVTAALAYVGRYGRDSYAGIPNYLKKFQDGLENKLSPLRKKGSGGKIIAAAAASTTLTSWGGNLFAPVMKIMENRKKRIVDHFNRKYGTPGELEIGQKRLQDEPEQTWGDVIKGRVASWMIVFSAFLTIDALANKKKFSYLSEEVEVPNFERYEDWFGRLAAKFTKRGKEIEQTHIVERLNNPAATNRSYKIGRIMALDIYATTAAILIWSAISRTLANKRKKTTQQVSARIPISQNITHVVGEGEHSPRVESESLAKDKSDETAEFSKKAAAPATESSHTGKVISQRQIPENNSLQLG